MLENLTRQMQFVQIGEITGQQINEAGNLDHFLEEMVLKMIGSDVEEFKQTDMGVMA